MRPLRFPQLAPNRGLAIGAGVAQGLNSAMANYMKMRNQNIQMQNAQIKNQQMGNYYKHRADMEDRMNQSADFAKVRLAEEGYNALKDKNPEAAKNFLKAHGSLAKDAIANMSPQEAIRQVNQLMPHDLNPNENKLVSGLLSNQTKESVQGQKSQSYENVAGTKSQTAKDVANINAGAKIGATQINAASRLQASQNPMKSINALSKIYSDPMASPEAKAWAHDQMMGAAHQNASQGAPSPKGLWTGKPEEAPAGSYLKGPEGYHQVITPGKELGPALKDLPPDGPMPQPTPGGQ